MVPFEQPLLPQHESAHFCPSHEPERQSLFVEQAAPPAPSPTVVLRPERVDGSTQ